LPFDQAGDGPDAVGVVLASTSKSMTQVAAGVL